ncbi:hypothetical protein [Streptomyces spectabilis]|uniref:Secreted protein/lipoprotein n=1 Tax=Streptomyces spectabilis TaxID=68270 RepID=A0A7W8B2Z5_STRST|nr:hypothetical protein [Streptomyces spectabilis]MBB5109351.1 hypothetical protein [Streptomyces spectabilis]
MVLACCTAVVLTACSDSSDDDPADKSPRPPATSSASRQPAPSTDPLARDKLAVLRVYELMWEDQAKAYAQTDIKGTQLKRYATKEALGRTMGDLLAMKKEGTATKGAPSHSTKVLSLSPAPKVPRARLQDCLDISSWKTVKKKTGEPQPYPSDQPLRYLTTIDAEKWGKRWMITKITTHGSRTC